MVIMPWSDDCGWLWMMIMMMNIWWWKIDDEWWMVMWWWWRWMIDDWMIDEWMTELLIDDWLIDEWLMSDWWVHDGWLMNDGRWTTNDEKLSVDRNDWLRLDVWMFYDVWKHVWWLEVNEYFYTTLYPWNITVGFFMDWKLKYWPVYPISDSYCHWFVKKKAKQNI